MVVVQAGAVADARVDIRRGPGVVVSQPSLHADKHPEAGGGLRARSPPPAWIPVRWRPAVAAVLRTAEAARVGAAGKTAASAPAVHVNDGDRWPRPVGPVRSSLGQSRIAQPRSGLFEEIRRKAVFLSLRRSEI